MFKVIVHSMEGESLNEVFIRNKTATLGANKENTVVLDGRKVAKCHAQFDLEEDGVYVANRATLKPLFVAGQKVERFGPLTVDDVIQIADYKIFVKVTNVDPDYPEAKQSIVDKQKQLHQYWQRRLHDAVALEIKQQGIRLNSKDAVSRLQTIVSQIASDLPGMPKSLDPTKIAMRVYGELVGYGPLESLLKNRAVSEIMVNAYDEIFYEEAGQNKLFNGAFTDNKVLGDIIKRMVATSGRHIDDKSPLVDATLPDGSRVNAVIPPLAIRGPSLTLRKSVEEKLSATHLVNHGTFTAPLLSFLQVAVQQRKNIVIAGGTGTGKSTLLNVLSSYIPEGERIVTIEDAAELALSQRNRVALESRPPDAYGQGEIHIRDLVKNALRMSPDRIIVGECRGGEALDMLQAMNTGHDGSLTTIHANTPRDCISRLEVLVLMSGVDLPVAAIRSQIASAVDIIVQITRFPCGSRKVTSISEVCGVEGNTVQLGELFAFQQSGYGSDGKVLGEFKATGVVPSFYEQLRERGIAIDMSIFQ